MMLESESDNDSDDVKNCEVLYCIGYCCWHFVFLSAWNFSS